MTTSKPPTNVDGYISSFPSNTQIILERIRRTIRNAAPAAVETMSYGIPTFDLNGRHLIFFAAWQRHISLYPLPAGDNAFQERIQRYKRAKSSVHFPISQDVPYELVEEIVALLVAERTEAQR